MNTNNRLDLWLHAKLGQSSAARWSSRIAAIGVTFVMGVLALLMVIWDQLPWYGGAAAALLGLSNAVWIWRISAPPPRRRGAS